MRRFRWYPILLTAALLFSSCQTSEQALSLEGKLESGAPVVTAEVAQATEAVPQTTEAAPQAVEEVNECLECHSDKDQLIDTAKPEEEPAEGESKGVG